MVFKKLGLFFFFSGSAYYDNVRPLSYPDSDAVLVCFDISKAETLDSVLKKVSNPQTSLCKINTLYPFPCHQGEAHREVTSQSSDGLAVYIENLD